jgi:DmsE family decaheme c-type cytochrome
MSKARLRIGVRKLPTAAAVALIAIGTIATIAVGFEYELNYPERFSEAEFVGDETCAACHEEVMMSFSKGLHGRVHEFEAPRAMVLGCEACHGPGSLHVDSNEPADILNPVTAEAHLSVRLCLQCHTSGSMGSFQGTTHAMNEVSCTSCHSIHGPQYSGLPKKMQPDICYGCHANIRGKSYLPSLHPVKEGKMYCSDCHDPHGDSYQSILAGERTNDLCLSCHANKEGPFVFEHAPVIEDCGICHDPHGAVANNLLVQNEPFICLQCHQMHFHTTLEGIEGDFDNPLGGIGGTSSHDASKSGFLTKCTQCHSEIHGSDLPSQSISGQGKALTR